MSRTGHSDIRNLSPLITAFSVPAPHTGTFSLRGVRHGHRSSVPLAQQTQTPERASFSSKSPRANPHWPALVRHPNLNQSQRFSLASPGSCMLSCFSCVQLFTTLWTIAPQVPLSMGFSRPEYWSGLPCPPPGDLPDPGIEPTCLTSPALTSRFFSSSTTWEAHIWLTTDQKIFLEQNNEKTQEFNV